MGGKDFDLSSLLRLLGNSRIRGYHYFYDNWNMFSDLQDKDGWVCWEYRHHKEHGNLLSQELFEKVNRGLEKVTYCSRTNDFFLSGILYAADGSRYYGEAAKSGQYPYYYNRTDGKRFPAPHVHKLVFKRLGELLEHGNFEKLIEKIRCHEVLGTPQFSAKCQRVLKELRRLDEVIENFSAALRENVAKNNDNLIEVIEEMIAEKKKATEEIKKFKKALQTLDLEEERFRKALRGEKFKRFVEVALRSIEGAHPLEQRKFLQAVIPKMVIHHGGEAGYYLQLFYNGLGSLSSGREESHPCPAEKL